MALAFANRVAATTTTTGTGALDLSGPLIGYRSFATAFSVGDTLGYVVVDETTGDFECGIGTMLTPTSLERTSVDNSSAGGAKVNFAAGTKIVGATTLAADQSMDMGVY